MIKIELTLEEWNKLMNCAALAPYVQIAQLLEKLAMQIRQQQQAIAQEPSASVVRIHPTTDQDSPKTSKTGANEKT